MGSEALQLPLQREMAAFVAPMEESPPSPQINPLKNQLISKVTAEDLLFLAAFAQSCTRMFESVKFNIEAKMHEIKSKMLDQWAESLKEQKIRADEACKAKDEQHAFEEWSRLKITALA